MRSWCVVVVLAGLALQACVPPTKFEGDAKFPDGVAGCKRACTREGLDFGGFVFSGEFATSCVCQPVRAPGAGAVSAQSNATAGVIVQTQAAAAAAAANSSRQLWMQQQQQHQHQGTPRY